MARLEDPHLLDEPDPIVIGQGALRPAEPRSFADDADDVGPIRLESIVALAASGEWATQPVVPARAKPSRSPINLALSLGLLAGVIVGGGVGVWLRRDLSATRRPSVVAAHPTTMATTEAPPAVAATGAAPVTVQTAPAQRQSGLNLDHLARSLETGESNASEGRFSPSPPAASPARPAPVQVAVARPPPPPTPPAVSIPSPSEEVAAIAGEPSPPLSTAPALDAAMTMADRKLSLAYDFAMARAKDRTALHDEQARWLAAREGLTGGRESWIAMTQDRTNQLNAQGQRDRRRR